MIRPFESRYNKIKNFYVKYERRITPVAFFVGFIWDSITLQEIDFWLQNIVFIVYLSLAASSITFINAYESGRVKGKIADKFSNFMPIVMQFVFGGLFSAFLVFYSRSTSVLASWPFLLVIVGLFVGNEFFRKRYQRLTFQISIFFVTLFFYSVFALPIVVGSIGTLVFIGSGIVALICVAAVLFGISKIIPGRIAQARRSLTLSIGAIYAVFNVFYFTNLIPPIPLSVADSGIFQSLEPFKTGEYIYRVRYESQPWYMRFRDVYDTVRITPGQPLYSYSAIFAPTKINTTIYHRWSYFDEIKGDWVQMSRIPFSIAGGRENGYRGYTIKYNVKPGKWRVDVINERGQILGRKTFNVVNADVLPELETAFR